MKYTNHPVLSILLERANKKFFEKQEANTTETHISVNGKIFVEKAFSGCGRVSYTFDKKYWREAKKLGCHKGYRDWTIGGDYYNGQFGDACSAYREALYEIKKDYQQHSSLLDKIDIDTWID